jgi:D-amino peptidase
MRVYLSVDMEGIAGVNHPGPTGSGHARYPAAVDLMVGETNAAIEGALAAGAEDILVNDSHGSMFNLLPERIHPAALVLQGQKPWSMVEGAGPDAGFDVALFVGTTPAPGIRAGPSPIPIRSHRSRRASTVGRPESTGSTR